MLPLAFKVATPLLGPLPLTTPVVVSVSESGSESLERTIIMAGVSSSVESESLLATGRSLPAAFTLMVTAFMVVHRGKNHTMLEKWLGEKISKILLSPIRPSCITHQ